MNRIFLSMALVMCGLLVGCIGTAPNKFAANSFSNREEISEQERIKILVCEHIVTNQLKSYSHPVYVKLGKDAYEEFQRRTGRDDIRPATQYRGRRSNRDFSTVVFTEGIKFSGTNATAIGGVDVKAVTTWRFYLQKAPEWKIEKVERLMTFD